MKKNEKCGWLHVQEKTSTASFPEASESTESILQDWVQNLKLKFSTDTSSPYFQELYAGSKVYEGELNMFRAVTDQSLVCPHKLLRQSFKLVLVSQTKCELPFWTVPLLPCTLRYPCLFFFLQKSLILPS